MHNRDRGVWSGLGARFTREDPHQLSDFYVHPGFLARFPDNPFSRRFIWFNKPAWQAPAASICPFHQQNFAILVEDGGVGPDFWRNMSEFIQEPLSYGLSRDR